ncbi:hypothetical protein D3C86_1911950 [compost metagenome]
MTLTFQFFQRVSDVPGLDLLVGVFDHHHRGVDHGTDGNRDPTQGHDIGVDPLMTHDDKSNQHANRQRDDRHQRRA